MTIKELCNLYLEALNKADLRTVQAMFSSDGVVISPLYGEQNAHDFYASLFADTSRSETKLLNVFDNSDDGTAVALHFQYVWTLKGGKVVNFECVDVFELSDDRQQFKKLTIIYDTAHLRDDFERVTGQ